MKSRRAARLAVLGAAVALALVAAACSSGSKTSTGSSAATDSATTEGPAGAGGTINLVAYSTPEPAYTALATAFNKTGPGKGVKFNTSYGASGDQSRAVLAGQPADYVAFSLETDVTRLVPKLVDPSWNANQYKGMVTDSVVVFVVRKGNPKNIKTWDDLTKPGIQVITPNPFSSGSARWNTMAGWGAQIKQGKTEDQANDYLAALFKNVAVQDTSGAAALTTFSQGKGDVLISYENEAIFAQQNNVPVDYVIPDQTLLIENPATVTNNSTNPVSAKAWLDFLYTPAAQQIFADNGYRPVVAGITPKKGPFPTPPQLFTIQDLGGWPAVATKFFDAKTGIVAKIEQANGVSTGS